MNLRELLDQLEARLQDSRIAVDAAQRRSLERIRKDIEALLKSPQNDPSLRQRIEDGVEHFQASHPALSETLARLAEALAKTGL